MRLVSAYGFIILNVQRVDVYILNNVAYGRYSDSEGDREAVKSLQQQIAYKKII